MSSQYGDWIDGKSSKLFDGDYFDAGETIPYLAQSLTGIVHGTDTILDFEVGIDRIGLVEGELGFVDLTITQDGDNTLLGVVSSGEVLAVLNNVQATALDKSSFVMVADVSNINQATQILSGV